MSHLNRVLLVFPLMLLCTSSSLTQTAAVSVISHQTAKQLQDLCRDYIAMVDGPRNTPEHPLNTGQCLGYIQGLVDGFDLAMASLKVARLKTSLTVCVPKTATTDEMARVTLKYIGDHSKDLSNTASDEMWRAMISSYPCRGR
jgi:hypothetical protein